MFAALPLILSLAPEIARWLGGSQAATVTTSITGAIKQVTGTDDPDAAAATLAADPAKTAELRVQLAKIAADAETAQREADLESLKAELAADTARRQAELDDLKVRIGDTGSARSMAVDLAKSGSAMAWGSPILSVIIVVAFAVMIFVVVKTNINETTMPLANVLLGTLAALATQVCNYWLGSSSGSRNKDAMLQNAQDKLANTFPASAMPHPAAILPAGPPPPPMAANAADNFNAAELSRARARA